MKKINKVMLASANNRWHDSPAPWVNFAYTFGMLTAVLKNRYDVKILDASFYNLNEKEVKNKIADYKPDVFGITCMSMKYSEQFQKMSSLAKEAYPKTKIVAGGIYPTLLPEAIMRDKNIDYAVLGEGEYRFPNLLENIEKGKSMKSLDGLVYRENDNLIIQKVENYIQDLDALPFPCYDNLDFFAYAKVFAKKSPQMMPRRLPYTQTITARGCPFDCIFCSSKAVNGPKIRFRSSDSVLKEVEWLIEKYKIKELIFLDDNFYIDKNRAKKILRGLIKIRENYDLEWKTQDSQIIALDDEMLELIKESGSYQINLSVECGSEEQLRLMNKPIKTFSKAKHVIEKAKSLGLSVTSPFIIGIPGETWEQMRKTGKFAEELDLDYCIFNIATPLPKTELYRIAKEKNFLSPDFNFDNFRDFGHPSITTKEFTPSDLLLFRVMEWDRINFKTPEKIKKIAEICGITLDELEEWRVSTRRGVDVKLKL